MIGGGVTMGDESATSAAQRQLAEAVRDACLRAALDAYEGALTDGLCAEGAWEVAVGVMQSLDVAGLVREVDGREM